jgi:hypothetical protein
MIICVRGRIWVTQACDLRDYVMTAGDVFLVTQQGSVVIQALCEAFVQVTAPLRDVPYRGDYPVFQ